MAVFHNRPFGRANTTWARWSADVESCSTSLDAGSLFEGQRGGGVLDAIIARVTCVGAAGGELAMGANELAAVCGAQDGHDEQLARAPRTGDVLELRRRMEQAQKSEDASDFDEAAEKYHTAVEQREAARRLHEEQTSGTRIPDAPATGFTPTTGAAGNPANPPGFPPGGGSPDGGAPADEGGDAGASGDDEVGDGGDPGARPQPAAQGPQPQMAQHQPQTPQWQPQTPQWQPAAPQSQPHQPNFSATADRGGFDDSIGRDDHTPGNHRHHTPDTGEDEPPGTRLTADTGGVVHGSTTADTSGKSPSPYAATGAPPGTAANQQSGMGRGGMMGPGMMGSGMMGPGMMGPVGRGGETAGRPGSRPEVLSADPEGRIGDEFAFDGGLIGMSSEERAAEAWFTDTRDVVEALENPHVHNQR